MPEYTATPLREQDVDADPLRQFGSWFERAAGAGIELPEACAVATASPDGAPSVRMVLLKQFDERGYVFYTNFGSRKAAELRTNARAALLFYWQALGRQVRIEGPAARTNAEESLAYSLHRPRGSQVSALASPQSRVVESREQLERRVAELAAEYEDRDLPAHDNWGGFRITPDSYEFWQQRDDRLHDRLRYLPEPGGGWRLDRLAP